MLEALITLIFVIALAACAGVAAWFTWWCMGSPHGGNESTQESSVHTGRIFSFVGVWLIAQHNAWLERENVRLAAFWRAQKRLIDTHYAHNEQTPENETAKAMKVYNMSTKNERRRRANPWKAAGTCLACFAFWAGVVILCTGIALGALGVTWLYYFYFFAVPFFSAAANKLLR